MRVIKGTDGLQSSPARGRWQAACLTEGEVHGEPTVIASLPLRLASRHLPLAGEDLEPTLDTATLFVIPTKADFFPPPWKGGVGGGSAGWLVSRIPSSLPTPSRHPLPAVTRSQFRHPSESWGIPVMERTLAARDPSFRWGDGEGRRTLPSSSPRACSGVHGSAQSQLSSPRDRGCRNKPGMTDYLKRSANRVPARWRCGSSTPRWASCTSRRGW